MMFAPGRMRRKRELRPAVFRSRGGEDAQNRGRVSSYEKLPMEWTAGTLMNVLYADCVSHSGNL